MANSSKTTGSGLFSGLLLGGTIGFFIGLLTAPKTGAQMRKELVRGADGVLNQVNDQFSDLSELVSDKVQPITKHAEALKAKALDKANDFSEKVTTQAEVLRDKVTSQAEVLKEKVTTQADALRDKVADTATDLKQRAAVIADALDVSVPLEIKGGISGTSEQNQALLNNFMGNNSGPVYTAGYKADPNKGATSMSDAGTTFTANKKEAAGG